MKNILAISIFMISICIRAEIGSEGGGGGSAKEVKILVEKTNYLKIISKIGLFFEKHPELDDIFDEVDLQKLVKKIPEVKFEVIDSKNYSESYSEPNCTAIIKDNKIICDFESLMNLKEYPKAQYVFLLHFLYDLLEVTEDYPKYTPMSILNYEYTKKLIKFVKQIDDFDLNSGLGNEMEKNCIDIEIVVKGNRIRKWNDPKLYLRTSFETEYYPEPKYKNNSIEYKVHSCLDKFKDKRFESYKVRWSFDRPKIKYKEFSMNVSYNNRQIYHKAHNKFEKKQYEA